MTSASPRARIAAAVHRFTHDHHPVAVPAGTLRLCTAPNGRMRTYLSYASDHEPVWRYVPLELEGLVQRCTEAHARELLDPPAVPVTA